MIETHADGWGERYNLHDLARVCWVGSALRAYRPYAAYLSAG